MEFFQVNTEQEINISHRPTILLCQVCVHDLVSFTAHPPLACITLQDVVKCMKKVLGCLSRIGEIRFLQSS